MPGQNDKVYSSSPAVTVLMPAYNAAAFIAEAIRSVLEQSFTDFELLIVNDGSTDHTVQVIRQFDDKRIVLVERTNGGVSAALNTGLEQARGRLVARFDADDVCYPGRLATQVAFMAANPDHVLVGSEVDYITEQGSYMYHHRCFAYDDTEIRKRLFYYCPFIHSAVMYRLDSVREAGGYNPMAHTFEDYFLWVKLLQFGKAANLRKSLIQVRLNPESVTIDEKWRGSRFRQLRRTIIISGMITGSQETELLQILRGQNNAKMKNGAYYALCAKKYLTDNYMPETALEYAWEAIKTSPFRLDNYALWIACHFPQPVIQWLHRLSPNRL